MYKDYIKLFSKKKNELEILIQGIGIRKLDIGMEFGIEKCAMQAIKSEKGKTMEGIELSNQESIRTLGEKENYKYLEILKTDTVKQAEMKEKIRKEYPRRMRKLPKRSSVEISSKE